MALVLPSADPGYLLAWFDDADPRAEWRCKVIRGEKAASTARYEARALIDAGNTVRVLALLEIFHSVSGTTRRLPDDYAPVVDLLLREQLAGKGLTTARRGPPSAAPADVAKRVAEAKPEPEPNDEEIVQASLFGEDA